MTSRQEERDAAEQLAELKDCTIGELRELAREAGLKLVSGRKKQELIEDLLDATAEAARRIEKSQTDWLEVQEAGPYWLSLQWTVSEKLLKRAVSSLGRDWHRAKKTLRLFRVESDDSGPHARKHECDFFLPDEVTQWFVQLDGLSSGWKVEIGYLAPSGKFFSLLHSSDVKVETAQKYQFSATSNNRSPDPQASHNKEKEPLVLSVEGDVILNGRTDPGALTTVDDHTVEVHARTGQFRWKVPIQIGRVVIPIVAESGNQRLRAVISLESNIHYLEPEKTSLD